MQSRTSSNDPGRLRRHMGRNAALSALIFGTLTDIIAAQDALLVVNGDKPGGSLGAAVDRIDLDHDGIAELAIGAPLEANNAGRVRIVSAATGGDLMSFTGAPGEQFGFAVRCGGDVDHDGTDDLLVGVPAGKGSGSSKGDLRVMSGANGTLLLQVSGKSLSSAFGHAVAPAGDVNGDGAMDIVVGAWHENFNGSLSGSVFVLSSVDGSELRRIDGANKGDSFGSDVAGPGDIDADGFDDLLAGAEFSDAGGMNNGSATAFSGQSGAILFSLPGPGAGARFGHAVAALGDITGNGVPDFAVSGPYANVGGVSSGLVRMYSGATGAVHRSLTGAIGDRLGIALAGAGDFNGDGLGDLLVGAEAGDGLATDSGTAAVFSATGELLLDLPGEKNNDHFGSAVAPAGDLDGDGFMDVLVGASGSDAAANNGGRLTAFSGCNGTNFSYGTGCPGAGGFVPDLRLLGCPMRMLPLEIRLEQALGGTLALIVFGLGQAAVSMKPGCHLLVAPLQPAVLLYVTQGFGAGKGTISEPAMIEASSPSGTVTFQAFLLDPGAPLGFSASNAVFVTIPP